MHTVGETTLDHNPACISHNSQGAMPRILPQTLDHHSAPVMTVKFFVIFKWGLCIIIDQLNRNFGRGGSSLNRVCCCNMFHCCCVPDCSSAFNRERHLSCFTLPLKSKRLPRCWVHVIRQRYLPLNRHAQFCSKYFVGTDGRRLCILTKFHRYLHYGTAQTRATSEERLQDINLHAGQGDEPVTTARS